MKWVSLFAAAMVWVGLFTQSHAAVDLQENKVWSLIAFNRADFPPKELTDIEHMVEGGTVHEIHVHVLEEDLERIASWSQPHRLIARDLQTLRPRRLEKDIGGDYHTLQTMRVALESMVELYPDLARISVIGYSVEGRPIDAIVISDNVSKRELEEPCLRMVAAYHGDEWASTEVTIATAWALLSRYESDSAVQKMVDDHEFWIIPILNPDGYLAFDRRNANRIDLNRNFSWAYEDTRQSGDHPFSEPETLALYDLSMTRAFHHNLSVHSGAVNLGWVWNHQEAVSPDEEWFRVVSEKYLANTSAPDFWITNGAQWYMVNGEATDWLYGSLGGHDYTLEVSVDKAPPAQMIPDLVEQHLESTLGFYDQTGFRGRVTSTAGESIEASITILDKGRVMVSDPRTGAYYRPLAPGTYQARASALGFSTIEETVVVGEGAPTRWSPVLSPKTEAEVTGFGVLSNSVSGEDTKTAFIDSEKLVSILSAGATLELYRVGAHDSYRLPLTIDDNRIFLELNNLERTLRESRGFWDLLLKDAEGEVLHRFAQAIFLVDTVSSSQDPSEYSLEKVDSEIYIFRGPAEQPGTELTLLGPQLKQKLPMARLTYESGSFRFELDAQELEMGDWHLRLTQAGRYKNIPRLIRSDGDELSLVEVDKALNTPDFEPSGGTQGGCTCQSGQPMGWMILLALSLRLLRRRDENLFNEAR